MKKILWKSDLWHGTLAFGAIALACWAFLFVHAANGEGGEAFSMGIASLFPTALALLCAFTDRGGARAVWIHPSVRQDLLERSGVLEASCLNPDSPVNAERIRRGLDKDRPPDIG